MIQLFLISLVFILIGGLFLYRYTGKKRLLKFDLVQLIYAFVIAPLVFIWLKSFVYYLLQSEATQFTSMQLFMVDTLVSLAGLFVYAFVIIHFITKNFEIKRYRDPFYDIFQLSEVIHLWISHLGFIFGATVIATFLAVLNVLLPLQIELSSFTYLVFLPLSIALGVALFVAVWLSNFTKSTFMKINKIMFALHFFLLITVYFIFDVRLTASFFVYWFFFFTYLGANISSFYFEKSKRLICTVEKWHHKYRDGWSALENRFLHPK
jgi:MFS family permease